MKRPGDAVPNYLLRSAREYQGWTQEELAEKIGTTSVTISRWESGITFPSRYFRKKLSTLYGKSIQELGLLQDEYVQFAQMAPALPITQPLQSIATIHAARPIFLFNEPLPDPDELYGRKCERETLLNRTLRKASTSIIGPRRIGKTWLVDYLRLIAPRNLGSRFHIGYLDGTMPSCRTVNGFVTEALDVLHLPGGRENKGLVTLEKGLKALKAKQITPVLCIDEFEGLGNRKEFTLDFFRGLRAMTHSYGLVLVVASRNPLSAVVGKDVETSGFFNIFEQIVLEPFNIDEASEFIQQKGRQAAFTEQESAWMWKYGEESEQEWPALRLQLIGKMLLDIRQQVQQNTRNDAQNDIRQKFEQRLEQVYREVVY